MHDYDVVILGGGLAYAGAELLRNKGLKVAIVEKEEPHLGGVCLHEGCVPTKLYLAHAQKGKRVNLADLKKKKEDITSRLREDIKRLLKGVDFVYGYGELVEPHTVLVEGKKLSAKYVIINTGKSYTKSPNGKDLLELEELPKSLNLVGDDPTALEFACMFALFGSSVNLYFDQQSLDFVHPSIKGRLLKMLKDIGINLYKPEDFKQGSAYFLNKRAPNSTCVRLELARDKVGHLLVDRNYETTLPNHYAVGDINGLSETAHASRLQAISVAKRISEGKGFYTPPYKIPYVLYTLPLSYAKVGLTKKELEERKIEHKEVSVPFRPFAVGSIYQTEEGLINLYFDKKDFLLGAEVFCVNAQEVIASLTVSLFAELNRDIMSRIAIAHPTLSEVAFIRL